MSDLKAVFISDIHLAPGEDWSHCIWKYTPNEELPGLLEQWKNMVNDELKPDVVFELGDRIIDVDRALLVLRAGRKEVPSGGNAFRHDRQGSACH